MNILITGNMGYVGPSVVNRLRASYPDSGILGLDIGYFSHCLTGAWFLPECRTDAQYFSDVRTLAPDILKGVESIIHLAAISNDPMGNIFEDVTLDINYKATVSIARQAKAAGVKTFVFASSCSVYGFAEGGARKEDSQLNPLTAYAKSKVFSENDLEALADENFKVTCLRFATACGMSDRLRLDLVLNDFVASSIASNKITILSDGTPWRPLINVKDMARAIDWAIQRDKNAGGVFLSINVGSNEWNYQVRDLAAAVAEVIPGVEVSINEDALPDKRSYQVSFDLFEELAPGYQPQMDLLTTIKELKEGLTAMGFNNKDFRDSTFMRLKALTRLKEQGLLSGNLEWNFD